MSEPLEKLEKIEEKNKEKNKEPRGYLLFIDIKLGFDVAETAKYYIGVPMTKARGDCPFVFTLSRNHAMRFKTREVIGKFISKFKTDLRKTARTTWNGYVFIQDVDSEDLVVDNFHVDLF